MSYPRPPLEGRFWKAVSPCPNTGCWLWDGATSKTGYGRLMLNRTELRATHVSLMLHGQPRPSKDAYACHHCDVPQCVNPDHLYWGTGLTNVADAFLRGRRIGLTHCKRGHEFTPENTRPKTLRHGGQARQCLACASDMRHIRYLRDKQEGLRCLPIAH
jgi:hypothetical protein